MLLTREECMNLVWVRLWVQMCPCFPERSISDCKVQMKMFCRKVKVAGRLNYFAF